MLRGPFHTVNIHLINCSALLFQINKEFARIHMKSSVQLMLTFFKQISLIKKKYKMQFNRNHSSCDYKENPFVSRNLFYLF